MKLKTSTKISLKFTLLTFFLILLFSIIVNIFHFQSRYQKEIIFYKTNDIVTQNRNNIISQIWMWHMQQNKNKWQFPIDSTKYEILDENKFLFNLWKVDNLYYILYTNDSIATTSDVSRQVEMQLNLINRSAFILIFFSMISYVVSLLFVRNSLKDLNKLVVYSKNINLDNLNQKIDINWPDDDEIKIVTDALNTALSRIYKQTESLKSFIASVSHELKTPLMKITSEIDYWLKSKDKKQSLENIKDDALNINQIIDLLLLITSLENNNKLEQKSEKLAPILDSVSSTVSANYSEKKIKLSKTIDKKVATKININGFEMIAKNLIENAYKYTQKGWEIEIVLTDKSLIIKDNGVWIAKNDQEKIRERFWTKSKSRTDENSFWLWLYLVKLLVQKHWWKIKLDSKPNQGSKFEITF